MYPVLLSLKPSLVDIDLRALSLQVRLIHLLCCFKAIFCLSSRTWIGCIFCGLPLYTLSFNNSPWRRWWYLHLPLFWSPHRSKGWSAPVHGVYFQRNPKMSFEASLGLLQFSLSGSSLSLQLGVYSTPFCYKISDIFFSRWRVVSGMFWLESESLSFEFRISLCLRLSSSASNTEPFLPFNRSVIMRLGIAFNAVQTVNRQVVVPSRYFRWSCWSQTWLKSC